MAVAVGGAPHRAGPLMRGLLRELTSEREPAGGPRRVRRGWESVEAGLGWGWAGGPSLAGRGLARFVPVGTRRPQPAEWAGAGQQFSSLRGVRWASADGDLPTAARLRGGGEGGLPAEGPGKGAQPGTPPPSPTRGWEEQKAGPA